MAIVTISGERELRRTLTQLQRTGVKKVQRAGVSALVGPVKKQLRRAVNSVPTSTRLKKAVRVLIGSKIKSKSGLYTAKVGLGVGRQSKAKGNKQHERSVYGQAGAKLASGVGIGQQNVHWTILGTSERRTKTGRETGQMPDDFRGVVPSAWKSSKSHAVKACAVKSKEVLKKEARKRR